MTTTLEILRAARAKIERPECWTKGAFARDAVGGECMSSEPDAVCWCSDGAIGAVIATTDVHDFCAFEALSRAIGNLHVAEWNDAPERTHAEVLAAFDAAIAAEASK